MITVKEGAQLLAPHVGNDIHSICTNLGLDNFSFTDQAVLGQMMERAAGCKVGNHSKDYINGDCKAARISEKGTPQDAIKIGVLSCCFFNEGGVSCVDDFMTYDGKSLPSKFASKIENILLAPFVRTTANKIPPHGFLHSVYTVELQEMNTVLLDDFRYIQRHLNACTQEKEYSDARGKLKISDGNIHTLTAKYLILKQADTKPYTAQYSHLLERNVSEKQYGLYLSTRFTNAVLAGKLGSKIA